MLHAPTFCPVLADLRHLYSQVSLQQQHVHSQEQQLNWKAIASNIDSENGPPLPCPMPTSLEEAVRVCQRPARLSVAGLD